MQITSGFRRILSDPGVYTVLQKVMGQDAVQRNLVENFIQPCPGSAILDIGCGPADILELLPEVDYRGFDISERYITRAGERFGARGTFRCKLFKEADLDDLPPIDVALMSGVLHHLDDEEAISAISLAAKALKPQGRLVTIDPCYAPGQGPVAKFLIDMDRGRNVRDEDGYARLAAAAFDSVRTEVTHRSWVPYTHCYMLCRNKT